MTEPYQPIRKFARNTSGRDYVVGDIHGEFVLLEKALDECGFDGRRDRLFSVGDLIDRGRDSPASLAWLAKPWFHAILGNHEAMALDAVDDPDTFFWWTRVNGGQWWLEQDEELRRRMLEALAALPLAIEVETSTGPVGLVHADVPVGVAWDRFMDRLASGEARAREVALWGRSRARGSAGGEVEGVARIYCGHTPVDSPRVADNVYFIDTGACYGRYLTVLPLEAAVSEFEAVVGD